MLLIVTDGMFQNRSGERQLRSFALRESIREWQSEKSSSGDSSLIITVTFHSSLHLHYELLLSPDVNTTRPHQQWFFFEVFNNEANIPYTFELINCQKSSSMFTQGMCLKVRLHLQTEIT